MMPNRRRLQAPQNRRKPSYFRPMVEWLEDRTLPSTIFGGVWSDLIADGVRDAGEPPIAAVSMVLRQNNLDIQQTQTDGAGNYTFTDVLPGLYTVAALAPVGLPMTRDVSVGVSDLFDIDFGLPIAPSVPLNVEVTDNSHVQQMPSVAVDPLDANHVVMAYMDYSLLNNGYAGIGVAVSHDAGATWTHSSVPLPAHFDQAAGQPVVRFDAAGQVLVSFMAAKFVGKGLNGGDLKPGIIFDLTTDVAATPTNYLGKTVNRRTYGMQANNGVFLAISSDDGMNWNTPIAISAQRYDLTATTAPTPGGAIAAGATVTVTPDAMPADLFVGKRLIIDEGLPSMERVTVTAFTATTFTAQFVKAHTASTLKISVPVFFDTIPDLAVDTNPASPHYGNMYATWTRYYPASQFPGLPTALSGTEIMIAVSTDNGATWTTQYQNVGGVQFSATKDPRTGGAGTNTSQNSEGTGTNTFSHVTVGPEGGVYLSMNAGGRFPIFYSSDGGVTFRDPVPLETETMSDGYPFGVDSLEYTQIYPSGASTATFSPRATLFNNTFRTLSSRSIGADPVRPGHVYAVEAVPILTTAGTIIDAGEITFSRSTDYGVTWTPLFTVGDNPGNRDDLPPELQFRYRSALNDDNATRFLGFETTLQDEVIAGQALPQLSIDADGNIAVVWYDTRRDPNNKLLDVYSAVSTDGGLTFSANSRVTAANFNADTGVFVDARNANNFLIGDAIGLALAGGKAFAAWTGTTAGNQNVYFSSFPLAQPALGDRFEPSNSAATAIDLGRVTTQRVVPQLSLAGADHDWFQVQAGAAGQFAASASAALFGGNIQLELWNSTGTIRLGTASPIIANGQVIGQQISINANANDVFLVHVLGSGVPNYALTVQSLTADLGTSVSGSLERSIAAGARDVYRLTAGVGGSLDLALTPGAAAVGKLNLQVLSADGQTVLATSDFDPAKNQTGKISVPVDQGQSVLLQVASVTTTSVLVHNGSTSIAGAAPLTLNLGTPGTAVLFGTVATSANPTLQSATIQVNGDKAINVRVIRLTSSLGVVSTTDYLLVPGVPVTFGGLPLGGGFRIQALDPVGSGPYHLEFTNKDIFQSSQQSMFVAAPATPASVVSADVNGDQRPDLILTSTQGSDQVQVMLANADGTFQSPRAYNVGSGQAAISAREPIVLDVTGDNIPDIIVPNYFSADVSVLVGNGDGTFAPQRRFDSIFQANSVASGDFNGDGKRDLAVLNRIANSATVAILAGRDDGTFFPPTHVPIPQLRLGDAYPVRVGDLNGDNKDDLVVFGLNDTKFQVLLGNGDGTFTYGDTLDTTEVMFDAQLVDLNGDNKLDVLIGGGNTGSVIVRTGRGDGTFNDPQIYATVPNVPGDNALVAGLAVADFGSSAGPGAPDGKLDVVVTTRYRKGSDTTRMSLLAGVAPDAQGRFLGAAQQLATLKEAGRISVADFNGDNVQDLAMTETGGVRIVYGKAPTIAANTTFATARNLGTVVHYLSQPLAIVPGFTDAYYKVTVPVEAAAGAGPQVLDFSALFQHSQGAGLGMEVLDANGTVLASGARFRITAAQGSELIVHVFSKPADATLPAGAGVYTLGINVLPQVVSIEAQSFFPGVGGAVGGPVTSLVITFQGDRLDPALAEDARNYVVTNLDTGLAVPINTTNGKAVFYNPGANVEVSSGRTFPTAVRQTVTLVFDQPLTAGTYRVEVLNLESVPFNATESAQLAPEFDGHALVQVNGASAITEHVSITVPNLVTATAARDLDGLTVGTSFMTQMTNDLAAELDSLLKQFGDDPSITDRLNDLIRSRCIPAWDSSGRSISFLVIWLDPVSIGLADPGSNRVVFNQQTNVTQNSINRTYVEVGGNVEVIVTAAVSGTYRLNVSDVQPTARGGVLILDGNNVQSQSLTAEMRGGESNFQFQFASPVAALAAAIQQAVTENNGSAASVMFRGIAARSTELAQALLSPEFASAILMATLVPGQGPALTALDTTVMPPEYVAAVEAFVEQWVERTVVPAVEGGMQDFRLGELTESIVNLLMRLRTFQAFRSLLGDAGGMQNRCAEPENTEDAKPNANENLDALVPLDAADRMAGEAAQVLAPANEAGPTARWHSILFTAVFVVGAAYGAAQGKDEREKSAHLFR
jgi:hypothetical protein